MKRWLRRAAFSIALGTIVIATGAFAQRASDPDVVEPKPRPTPTPTPLPGGPNALPISVTAGPFEEVDIPYASITVCATGTTNCTVVENVSIDTASFGLRIFGSQLSGLGITPNVSNGTEVGECAFFGSGSTWGSVSTVDVKMAGEPTITVPIQVMDDIGAFAPAPGDCTMGSQLIATPSDLGGNGLLGIGQDINDRPDYFTQYYICSGQICYDNASPPMTDVVPNPVSALPVDNNGEVVALPSIPAGGAATVNGVIYFGVGTESNNQPDGNVKLYKEDNDLNSEDYLGIITVFGGKKVRGILDTGTNLLFFGSSLKQCPDGSGYYCPPSTISRKATNRGFSGSPSGVVKFTVANADKLFLSNNAAFDNLAGGGKGVDGFDWGLPFFFGRTVYFGIIGSATPLGEGPYTAY